MFVLTEPELLILLIHYFKRLEFYENVYENVHNICRFFKEIL